MVNAVLKLIIVQEAFIVYLYYEYTRIRIVDTDVI